MIITTNLKQVSQTKVRKLPLYGILSTSLLAVGVTIGIIIIKTIISRDDTFELSENIPAW